MDVRIVFFCLDRRGLESIIWMEGSFFIFFIRGGIFFFFINLEVNLEELDGVWRIVNKGLNNFFEDSIINGLFKLMG